MTQFTTTTQSSLRFDIIFLSYHEPLADVHFEYLQKRFPWAKRIDGVKGLINALRAAAESSETNYFYLIDADNVIVEDFDFSFNPYEKNFKTYIWRAKNNVNGLEYGHGGVKMYHKATLLALLAEIENEVTDESLKSNEFHFHCLGDLPYSPNYLSIQEVASITVFDMSASEAWRAAFRECCKLAGFSNLLKLTDTQKDNATKRLEIWCTKGAETRYGSYVLDGANEGKNYGLTHQDDPQALLLINDFEWLQKRFNQRFTN